MSSGNRMVDGLGSFIIGRRRPLSIFFLLVTVLLGFSASRIELDPGFLKLIPVNHSYMDTMMEYMDDFSGANRVLVNLRWKGEGDIYNEEFLTALEEATDAVFFIPGINRTTVSSLFTPDTIYIEVTEYGFRGEPVIPARFTGTEEQLETIRHNVEHSGRIGELVANDHKGALIRADLLERGADGERVDYWLVQQKLTEIRDQFENENIEVNVIGFARLLGDVIKGLLGVFAFFALAFVLTMLLLYLYTRSLRITFVATFVAALPVLWLIGVLPAIGYGIDPMSILVPFLIFAIGVSHAVQMTSAWRLEIIDGADSVTAAERAFTKLFVPGSVALLTEALGFGVIMLIDIPIVHELGITASIGVLLMIITNKMILPILLSRLQLEDKSLERARKPESATARNLLSLISACATPGGAKWVLLVSVVLLATATWQSRDLVIGDSGTGAPELHHDSRYNYDGRVISNSYDIGTDILSVIVEAPDFEGDSCLHYPVMDAVDRFEMHMRGVAGVRSVTSVAGVTKRVVGAFNEGNPRWQALARSQAGLAVGSRGFDPQLGLNNESCRAIQVLVFMEDHEGEKVAHAVAEAKDFIAQDDTEGVTFRLASGNVGVMAATNEAVAEAEARMLLSIFGALLLFCLLSFRSWIGALCVLAPLAMVCVFANALMAMIGIGLKTATLPVIALGVGVGVDYGLYLFERIQHHMGEGRDFRAAFEHGMRERGAAIVFTALTMSIGVATWTMSALKFQADMGLLLAFMFLVNMFGAICLLPALGTWFFRRRA
ncbi:efflux RND transporter permease subunit [Algiphilus sp.]|uniref:efflux RND transporter permease subunit n=1 Tax=Algiphilus sp. TaxID=1872431 RepID=UPI003C55E1CA